MTTVRRTVERSEGGRWEYNRTGLDYRLRMPRPKVLGKAIDFHVHITAARHWVGWFDCASHYGFELFGTMTPLEEAVELNRQAPGRCHFIAIPKWHDWSEGFLDRWRRRIGEFYDLGSRIAKFWFAPPAWERGWRLDSEAFRPLLKEAVSRGMAIMTHVGDPEAWYRTKYGDAGRFGTRADHYRMWENVLEEYAGVPWLAAHMGGNPEDLGFLQGLLDRYANLYMDCSATKWIVREVCRRRDEAREFFIRNQDRIIFGTDLVTGDQRDWEFLASRFWSHRKLWETGYVGPSPIHDPDLPEEGEPVLRGLALPDECLQKLYRENALRFLARVGGTFGGDAG